MNHDVVQRALRPPKTHIDSIPFNLEQPETQSPWSDTLLSSLDGMTKDDSFKLPLTRNGKHKANVFHQDFYTSSSSAAGENATDDKEEEKSLRDGLAELQLDPGLECEPLCPLAKSVHSPCEEEKQQSCASEDVNSIASKSIHKQTDLERATRSGTLSPLATNVSCLDQSISPSNGDMVELYKPLFIDESQPTYAGLSGAFDSSSRLAFLTQDRDFQPDLCSFAIDSFPSKSLESKVTGFAAAGSKRGRLKRHNAAEPPSPEKAASSFFLDDIRSKIRRLESAKDLSSVDS